MKKSLGSFIALNRTPFLLLGVVLSLTVFSFIGWQATAQIKRTGSGGSAAKPGISNDGNSTGISKAKMRRILADDPNYGQSAPTVIDGFTCPATITQSSSQTITSGNTLACNSGSPNFFHSDTRYWRAFKMTTFGVPAGNFYNITSVDFGIETANAAGTGTTQPVTVRLYANNG